jgi:hypothetical protein
MYGDEDKEYPYSLYDCLMKSFSANFEDVLVILWNNIPILLTYETVVPEASIQIVDLLEHLQSSAREPFEVGFFHETFVATWNISFDSDQVIISSQWEIVLGRVKALLEESPIIKMPLIEFIEEWKRFARSLRDALIDNPAVDTSIFYWDRLLAVCE